MRSLCLCTVFIQRLFSTLPVVFVMLFLPALLAAQAPLEVIAKKIEPVELIDRLEALGTLKANESVTLTASVTEIISGVHFEDGQFVEEGTLLVEMRSAEEEALLAETRARLEEASKQYERMQPLREGGAAPTALIDERLREYETAKAQVSAIQARIDDRRIVAPFSGYLGLRNVSLGTLVTPGDEIITLDDISTMKLDFSIPSLFLAGVEVGMEINAKARAFPDKDFTGIVKSIGSRIDPATRAVVIRADLPNDQGLLRPGILMTVELLQNRRKSLVVPEEAVIMEGRAKFVFVILENEEGSFLERREIKPGVRQLGMLEVLSGVTQGENIVVHGTVQARDGQRARIIAFHEEGKSLQQMLGEKSGRS